LNFFILSIEFDSMFTPRGEEEEEEALGSTAHLF
jgi:hypothetical protein